MPRGRLREVSEGVQVGQQNESGCHVARGNVFVLLRAWKTSRRLCRGSLLERITRMALTLPPCTWAPPFAAFWFRLHLPHALHGRTAGPTSHSFQRCSTTRRHRGARGRPRGPARRRAKASSLLRGRRQRRLVGRASTRRGLSSLRGRAFGARAAGAAARATQIVPSLKGRYTYPESAFS